MQHQLQSIRKQFSAMALVSFLVIPIAGLAMVYAFDLVSGAEISWLLAHQWYVLFLVAMPCMAIYYFWNFLQPVYRWLEKDRNNKDAPHHLYRRLRIFNRSYWALVVANIVLTPFIFNLSVSNTLLYKGYAHTAGFLLTLAATSYILAMPVYLLMLGKLGRLARYLGLEQVFHGLRSRLIHTGAVIPLISLGLLAAWYYTHPGLQTWKLVVFTGVLVGFIILTALVSLKGFRDSLAPARNLLKRHGATTHSSMAYLRPQSTDEIGFLMQTISRAFKTLADQQSHMHAVVDNAAEGIIVTDDKGIIDTFNIAAENLFGCTAHEARGEPLSDFLPALHGKDKLEEMLQEDQELEGIHRNGRRISMSVRVSKMQMSDKTMYTCLVADITTRKAAQLKQKQAEARYRDLVETAHDLVWSVDANGNWTYLNNAAFGIYGCDPEDMIGHNISEVRDPDFAQQESVAFREMLAGKELYQFETAHIDCNGKTHYLSFNAKAHRDILGNIQKISGTARDISEKKEFEKELTYHAEHDLLTGLYNRRYFQQELERVTARVTRSAGTCGLLYIDLDQFKYVNDTMGHAAGDKLLIEISEQLSGKLREGELLSRFGGDEFTILLYNVNEETLYKAAEKFRNLLDAYQFIHSGHSVNVTCSIGAALIDNATRSADEAMAHADFACHVAKSKGRNCISIYNRAEQNQVKMVADMGWAARVREMLENDRFIQMYQPIVCLKTGQIHDYEVLIRMPCDDGQIIQPSGFLDSAKRFGLINNIDRWMAKHAIMKLGELKEKNVKCHFSINLSGTAFDDSSFMPKIRRWLNSYNVDPGCLTFEITESEAIHKLNDGAKLIQDLKDLGCRFALDDFGTGYSTFNYLKHLPVDIIKIDGSFVQGLANNPVDQAMVESMTKIAHALGKSVIAEWVEDENTYNYLKQIGVDYVQGYYLGKPSEILLGNDKLPKQSAQLTA